MFLTESGTEAEVSQVKWCQEWSRQVLRPQEPGVFDDLTRAQAVKAETLI